MINQEKELKLFLVKNLKTYFNLISQTDTFINDLAKAIIAKYPQILAEKVWKGNATNLIAETVDDIEEINFGHPKTIQVFIREVK